jgi:hypothetical protein
MLEASVLDGRLCAFGSPSASKTSRGPPSDCADCSAAHASSRVWAAAPICLVEIWWWPAKRSAVARSCSLAAAAVGGAGGGGGAAPQVSWAPGQPHLSCHRAGLEPDVILGNGQIGFQGGVQEASECGAV